MAEHTGAHDDPLTLVRIDVAVIKGLIEEVIAHQSSQIQGLDRRVDRHEERLNQKAGHIARHDERIQDLEEDNAAVQGKVFGVLGLLVAAASLIWNNLTP